MYSSFEDAENAPAEKIHEKITIDLVNRDKRLCEILSHEDRRQIINLISGKNPDLSLMKEIVSGPLDADKQDYLLRDSYFCGVKYGVYDFHRLINTMTSYDEGNDKHLAIEGDGVNSLEQFVLAKYYTTTQVYRHKVRLVSDAMIKRGIELGIERDSLDWLISLYSYEDSEKYLENYLAWDDERLVNKIIHSDKNGFAKQVFLKLNRRDLFKRVFIEKFQDLPEKMSPNISVILADVNKKENVEKKKKLEGDIAKIIGVEPEFTIINSYTIKNVREMSRNDESEIMIMKSSTNPVSFEQESTVFRSINERINDKFLEIYAPLRFTSQLDKNKKLIHIRKSIVEYLSGK